MNKKQARGGLMKDEESRETVDNSSGFKVKLVEVTEDKPDE